MKYGAFTQDCKINEIAEFPKEEGGGDTSFLVDLNRRRISGALFFKISCIGVVYYPEDVTLTLFMFLGQSYQYRMQREKRKKTNQNFKKKKILQRNR